MSDPRLVKEIVAQVPAATERVLFRVEPVSSVSCFLDEVDQFRG